MRKLATIAGLLAVGIGIAWHASRFGFIGDDAYISFRYAENLAHHGQLTWNAGEERVEGYSNFGWTALLAAGIALGLPPEQTALPLGTLFGILAAWMLFWLARVLAGAADPDPRRLGRRPRWYEEWFGGRTPPTGWDLLAPGLLACWGAYACWSSGGLETAMFTFLLTAAITLYVREEIRAQHLRPSGIVLALAAMTRPEGVLIFFVLAAHRLVWATGEIIRHVARRRPHVRREIELALSSTLVWAVGFVFLYGSYFLWRWTYYGYLYPNTYYIKIATTDAAKTWQYGMHYLRTFVRDYHLVYYAPALGLALAAGFLGPRGRLRRTLFWLTLALPILAVYTWHIVRFGGDFMAMHRFFVPVLPILALLIAHSAEGLTELTVGRLVPARARYFTFAPIAALLLGLFAARSTALDHKTLTTLRVTQTGYSGAYDNLESVAFMRKFADDRYRIGRWLRERVPKTALMAVGGAGAIVYASGLRAIDSFGLSDLHVAHKVKATRARPGHQKFAPLGYILRRRPDIICYPGIVRVQNWELRPGRWERRRWERLGYVYFCANPKGLYPSHYCCLMRKDRDLGLRPVSAYRDEPRR